MGGLAVLVIVGLYIFIAYKAAKTVERRWAKVAVIIVAVLILTADAIYGRVKLKHMCEAEAGLKVYRVVEHVEGFMDNSLDYWVREGGYQFVEGYPINGTVTRYSKQNGQIIREVRMFPKSQYRLSLRHLNEKEIYRKSQYLVEGIASGEVFATDTQIGFNGGWVERLIAGIIGDRPRFLIFSSPFPTDRQSLRSLALSGKRVAMTRVTFDFAVHGIGRQIEPIGPDHHAVIDLGTSNQHVITQTIEHTGAKRRINFEHSA